MLFVEVEEDVGEQPGSEFSVELFYGWGNWLVGLVDVADADFEQIQVTLQLASSHAVGHFHNRVDCLLDDGLLEFVHVGGSIDDYGGEVVLGDQVGGELRRRLHLQTITKYLFQYLFHGFGRRDLVHLALGHSHHH